ncbi:unnamed protein product [Victoria cruziana]
MRQHIPLYSCASLNRALQQAIAQKHAEHSWRQERERPRPGRRLWLLSRRASLFSLALHQLVRAVELDEGFQPAP